MSNKLLPESILETWDAETYKFQYKIRQNMFQQYEQDFLTQMLLRLELREIRESCIQKFDKHPLDL